MARIELEVTEGWQSENAPPGTVEEFTLIAWQKAVGDSVQKYDALFEYDPGKGVVEYTAPADGKLVEILIPDGSEGCLRGDVAGILEV